ncbi:hypothetical protein [Streptomyces turgidiscabies]|uniref:hypothetical protein n=1 Tax=Streptomyces turgidiscabies TaxID=85558 RepID=UPI0038F77054
MSSENTTPVAVDGRDALASVIIRPGNTLEAWAKGIDKPAAAHVLRHVADMWAPAPGHTRVLAEVAAERVRQDDEHGMRDLPDGTGQYPETLDADTTRMALDAATEADYLDWLHILRASTAAVFAETSPARLRAALIDAATDAVAWAEALDRRMGAPAPVPLPDVTS